MSIASLIRKEKDNTILEEKIKDAIKENSNGIISDAEIYLIAKSIISSTKNQSKN